MKQPESMMKVRIVAPRSMSYSVISALYNLELFHVRRHEKAHVSGHHSEHKVDHPGHEHEDNHNERSHDDHSQHASHHSHSGHAHDAHHSHDDVGSLDIGTPLNEADAHSKSLLRVRAVKSILGINESRDYSTSKLGPRVALDKLHDEIQELHTSLKDAEERAKHTRSLYVTVEALEKLGVDSSLAHLRYVAAFVGTVKDPGLVETKLKQLRIHYELKHTPYNDDHLALIVVQRGHESTVRTILAESSFVLLPLDTYKDLTSHELAVSLAKYNTIIDDTERKLKYLAIEHKKDLLDYEVHLLEEIKKAELPLQFATTSKSVIATGFVPKKSFETITAALDRATNHAVHIEELPIDHHAQEAVPVLLHNSKKIKNFEILTRLYELPSYFELDPTSLLFLTFPLFYGIMLGDVGYGLVLFFLFFFLKRKVPDAKAWFNVLMYAAVMSILFGAVFGEYFGFEHVGVETGESLCGNLGVCLHKEVIVSHGESHVVYAFPHLLNRAHDTVSLLGTDILTILIVSVIVGVLHLNFGLALGFINVYRSHGLKLAILEKVSWIVMQIGLVLFVLSKMNLIIIPWFVGAALLVLSVVMIYMGEGAKGIVEIPGLFSNMLSYMRLGALGLASVVLAVVINEGLAMPLMEKGGIFVVIALLIMIFGHGINIALGVIGPFLHGIRLHYVEFYSKFFKGGGIEYIPFGKKAQMEGEQNGS